MRPERAFVLGLVALALAAPGCRGSLGRLMTPDPGRGDRGSIAEPRGLSSSSKPDKSAAAQSNIALAQAYVQRGDYAVAREKLGKALKMQPDNADAYTLLGMVHERQKQPEEAGKHYARAAKLAPDAGGVQNNYGAWLCGNGRAAESLGYFERALKDPDYPTPAAALTNAGTCAAKAGDTAAAESYLRRALDVEPNNANVLRELATINYRKGDYLRARAFLQRREAAGAVDAATLDLAARVEDKMGDREAAERYRSRLRSEFPDYRPDASGG